MSHFAAESAVVRKLSDVKIPDSFYDRIRTGSESLDVVLGGEDLPGVMPGSVWLVSGSPGTGKSTLLMQMLEHMAKELGLSCLYNSGEEAIEALALRARRIGIDEGAFSVSGFATMAELSACITENRVQVCVVDSIAALVEGEDREQLHELVKRFIRLARSTGCTLFLIGHVTKAGVFSGKNSIAHDVDAHLSISINKETGNRSVMVEKNRVGPTLIPYDFTMTSKGIDLRKMEPSEGARKQDAAAEFLEEVKRLLLQGEKLSGYSHDQIESLRAFNRSGGFMRAMLSKAVSELSQRGFKVFSETIDRREHFYIDAPSDDGLNNEEQNG